MRKKAKKEIKDIIQTMLDAHGQIVLLLQNKWIAEAGNLLSQCQDCALHIGESIESSEGMDQSAVSYLEIYCEYLYKMSRAIERKKIINLKQKLDSSLKRAEYEINENISLDRMKIVFMPYKASMWDCMESVWETADADVECDAYVVPIPYFERDEQGKVKRLCYEGDMFPKDVPITSYEEFSLEAERPDIIYIHNPYDGNNYVTSVHPDYYCENLKKYADELVYIPYYILGAGSMPEMHRSLSAYNYIDKIIVQDKDKKESMLDFVPEEKIVAIGCPKVDHILKLNKKRREIIEYEIAKEWREKIAGKKVILFNVSINGILQNKRYAIDKIRYVLSQFEKREDIVLLWRPHPLIEATLNSMRPEMYEEYMEVKNSFIRKGKGIFDRTGDPGIAAVVADAYLGEASSSLVNYFGVLGKPVMYINWTVIEDIFAHERNFLYFHTFYEEGNALFFVPSNPGYSHELYRFDMETGLVDKIMTLPGSFCNVWACYRGIKKVQNKIILAPHNTEDVYIHDLDRKQSIKIVLSESKDRVPLFNEVEVYKERIFLLPVSYPAIVSIDLRNYEVCEFKDCIAPFLLEDRSKVLFIWAYYRKGRYLYLASCNESKMIIFNMEDESFEIKKIGNYTYGYAHMVYDGENFWLSAYSSNHIVRWNEKTEETREYIYPIGHNQSINGTFNWVLNSKDDIIVCYQLSTDIVFINKNTGECRRDQEIEDVLAKIENEADDGAVSFSLVRLLDEAKAVLFNCKNSTINIWDMNAKHWSSLPCHIPMDEMLNMEKVWIEKNCIFKGVPYSLSENTVSIPQFIDYIVKWDTNAFKQVYECYQANNADMTVGKEIHEYIIKN